MAAIPGWETFTPGQKKFLAVFPWFRTKKAASEYIGHPAGWHERQERINPMFKMAVAQREMSPVRIAQRIAVDLLGKSILRLDEMLEKEYSDKKVQMEAVKHLHRVAGLVKEGEGGGRRVAVSAQSVVMFGKPSGEAREGTKGDIIEAKVELIEGEEAEEAGH